MHFVGMSALTLSTPDGQPVHFTYNPYISAASLCAAFVLVYIGLWVCTRDSFFALETPEIIDLFLKSPGAFQKLRDKRYMLMTMLLRGAVPLTVGGFFAATGILVMHFTGMMAMHCDCDMTFDGPLVFASAVVAIVAAIAACWMLFRLLALYPQYESLRLLCVFIIAGAAMSMHYLGMVAASFTVQPAQQIHIEHGPGEVTNFESLQLAVCFNVTWNFLMNYLVQIELRNCYRNFVDTEQILSNALSSGLHNTSEVVKSYCRLKIRYRRSNRRSDAAANDLKRTFSGKTSRFNAVGDVDDDDDDDEEQPMGRSMASYMRSGLSSGGVRIGLAPIGGLHFPTMTASASTPPTTVAHRGSLDSGHSLSAVKEEDEEMENSRSRSKSKSSANNQDKCQNESTGSLTSPGQCAHSTTLQKCVDMDRVLSHATVNEEPAVAGPIAKQCEANQKLLTSSSPPPFPTAGVMSDEGFRLEEISAQASAGVYNNYNNDYV